MIVREYKEYEGIKVFYEANENYGDYNPSSILLFISRIENKINDFLPNIFGGSIFLIGRKNDTF